MSFFLCITLLFLVPAGNIAIDVVGTIVGLKNCVTTAEVCPNENITFWLYTRNTAEHPYQLNMQNGDDILKAPFVKNSPYEVIIHGYDEDRTQTPNKEIRPALFEHGDYNVISVDYGPLAKSPCYLNAVQNLKVVANCTAQLIDYIVKNMEVPLKDFHFIGFSLGAQTAGLLPNYLKSGNLTHITGLDPALPLFTTFEPKHKLDKTDADFVDVIHTNAAAMGKWEPSGHVDFYVNGGNFQPGCDIRNGSSWDYLLCNHLRSTQVYAESINSKIGFYGQNVMCLSYGQCDMEIMGFHTPNTARGIYKVKTNDKPPYAKGMPQL